MTGGHHAPAPGKAKLPGSLAPCAGSPAPCTDTTPLVTSSHAHVKVYKRRWYILLVFSLVAVLQGITTCL